MCLVKLGDVGYDIWVYKKKGFWSLGYSYAAKVTAEKWCEEMYGGSREIYHGATIIAAIILYLRPILPEIMIPDQDWQKKVVLYSIRSSLRV